MIISIIPVRISVKIPPVATPVYAQVEYIEETIHSSSILESAVEGEIGANLDNKCECVRWLREERDIPIRGDAKNIIPNVDYPFIGGVILISYSGAEHAGIIKYILPSGAIYFESANLEKCKVTDTVIQIDDEKIRGFYFKNPN